MDVDLYGLTDRRAARRAAERNRRLVLLAAVAAVTLFLLAVGNADTARRSDCSIGIGLEETAGGLQVVEVYPNEPARLGGLEAGDRILRVAGRRVETFLEYDQAALTLVRGRPVDFRVERDGEPVTAQIAPGMPFPWARVLIEGLACLGYLALGAIALLQGSGDLRARLLMLLSFSVAIELATPLDLLATPAYGVVALPALAVLIGLQIGTELHLAGSLPDRRRWGSRRVWLVPAFYATGLGLGVLLAVSLVADSAGWGFLPWSLGGFEILFWDVGVPLWAIAVVGLLAVPAFRWPEPLGRQQAGLVLLAGLPWTLHVLGLAAADFLGASYPRWVEIAEPLVLLVYPVAVFVAIFRYHLFDLEFVVKRSLVYACLTGVLILIFYGAIGAGGALLSSFYSGGGTSVWVVALATLLMGLLFSPLRKASQALIDRQFFPERRALRRHLVQLASDLPARGSLPAMGRELAEKLCGIFGLESAAVLLSGASGILSPLAVAGVPARVGERLLISGSDEGIDFLQRSARPLSVDQLVSKSAALGERLSPLDAALLVPLLRHEQLIGVLVVGRKIGGRPFPSEEIELLNLLSHHVATAFEYAQLFESATRDGLTGLLRRGPTLDHLHRELLRSWRFGRPLAIAMADIDRFKEVNDRYGHLQGDLMLKRVSEALAEGVRGTDLIGRYGGEEFLIVLPETDLEGGDFVAEKLRRLVEEVRAPTDGGEEIRVTISIGVAAVEQFPEGSEPEVNDLIGTADAALYEAKSGGRNRVHLQAAAL